ncbi:MAG: hypothetical protein ACK5AZ_22260 [Bryobacteraceae bacterium]
MALFRADRLELQVPDNWRNDTVYRFETFDDEEKFSMKIEHHTEDHPLDKHLEQKTQTVREERVQARLASSGDTRLADLPAKYYVIEALRGDEVPIIYTAVIAKLHPLQLLIVDFESPRERWGQSRAIFDSMLRSIRNAG